MTHMDSAGAPLDVIIVGGRPAGSTLSARLGQRGMRVLLLEKASLPSVPPASCPAIYTATMNMLDEIGADEADYARNTPQLRWWVTEIRDEFRTFSRIPDYLGRDYGYAIDRARFDEALWRNAERFPTVSTCQGFAVTDLVWEGERVIGVKGHLSGGEEQTFTAGCVIGADGRFSTVARKVGARSYEERTDLPTSIYYAYWKNAGFYDEKGPGIQIYGPAYGFGCLLMNSADDMLCVAVEGQSAILDPGAGQAETFYMDLLRKYPRMWRRLANAERVTDVHGMRHIGNLYRVGGGPGWALVGDALHQKDPLDGQGIYDAVFTAKVLSQALGDWKSGAKTWDQAMACYEAEVRAETYPMYLATLNRVQSEIYTRQPDWAYKTMIRWIGADPEYKRRLGQLLVRQIDDPVNWLPPWVARRAMVRGALDDAFRFLTRQPRSAQPLTFPATGSA